jgi:hypothetical protein
MKTSPAPFEQTIVKFIPYVGLLLATIQLTLNRSLWLDEAYLALNIIQKSSSELLVPMFYGQVAPILYLQIEKLISSVLPNSELGLRLFPFVSYTISLFFFNKIVHIFFKNTHTRIFCLSVFVFSTTLIYYASEVKQYMSDVMTLLVSYYFTIKVYENEKNKYACVTAIGIVSIFLSNIAPIVLFTQGIYLLHEHWRNKKSNIKSLLTMGFVWAFSFAGYYFTFLHNHPAKSFMLIYWSFNRAFMPLNPFDIAFYKAVFERMMTIFTAFFGFLGTSILPILFLTGGIVLLKSKKVSLIILIFLPILLHWILSGFKMYPFENRLVLYLCPLLICAQAFGFEYIVSHFSQKFALKPYTIYALFIPLLMGYSFHKNNLFSKNEALRKCLEHISQNRTDNAAVHVSYFTSFPFFYYQKTTFPQFKDNLFIGRFADTKALFEDDLKNLQGKTWFLFANNLPTDRTNMIYITDYYKSKNRILTKAMKTYGYTVYLLDMPNNTELSYKELNKK